MLRIVTPAQTMIRGGTRSPSSVLPRMGHSRSSTNSSQAYIKFGEYSSVDRMTGSSSRAVLLEMGVSWSSNGWGREISSYRSPTIRTFRTLPASCGYRYYGMHQIRLAQNFLNSRALCMGHTTRSSFNQPSEAHRMRQLLNVGLVFIAKRLSMASETFWISAVLLVKEIHQSIVFRDSG